MAQPAKPSSLGEELCVKCASLLRPASQCRGILPECHTLPGEVSMISCSCSGGRWLSLFDYLLHMKVNQTISLCSLRSNLTIVCHHQRPGVHQRSPSLTKQWARSWLSTPQMVLVLKRSGTNSYTCKYNLKFHSGRLFKFFLDFFCRQF